MAPYVGSLDVFRYVGEGRSRLRHVSQGNNRELRDRTRRVGLQVVELRTVDISNVVWRRPLSPMTRRNYGYTLRRAKGKGASGFIAYKNEKADRAPTPSSEVEELSR